MFKKPSLRLMLVLTSFCLNAWATANAEPKRFYYKIRLPETTLGCQQEADQVAAKFQKITNKNVTESSCKGTFELRDGENKYNVNSIVLTYTSVSELVPYTAFLGEEYFGVPGNSVGVFPSYASCLSSLDLHTKLYETKTGLTVLAATCEKGTYTYDKKFVLRIDGFHSDPKIGPRMRLYAFTPHYVGSVSDDLKAEVAKLVEDSGGEGVFSLHKSIYYYSKYPVPVRYRNLGQFGNGEECQKQIKDVNDIFAKLGSKKTIALCLSDRNSEYSQKMTLEVVTDVTIDISELFAPANYYTFEECSEDKARALDEASSRGYKPLGAICKKQYGDKYEMQIYKKLF